VIGALLAMFFIRKEGKQAGRREAQVEAAGQIAEVKEDAANATAEATHAIPSSADKFRAIVAGYLQRKRKGA